MSNKIVISNKDLLSNKFDESILIDNINRLSLDLIMKTQKNLSNKFIDEYLLDENYATFPEDYLTKNDIYNYQPQYFLKNK